MISPDGIKNLRTAMVEIARGEDGMPYSALGAVGGVA
jgi:hypothetical protein